MEKPKKQFKDQVQAAVDRTRLIAINNEIALHAKRKDLDAAMALFNSAIEQGIANSHTYAAAVNANIRCGSLPGAEKVLAEMAANGRRRDVIICTTMMKGYCGEGRLTSALRLLEEMSAARPVILPNVRTINTILRGCVQAGDIENADMILNKAQKDFKIALDVSSWEYLIILFCQGLRLDKALPVVGRLRGDPLMASGLVNMHVNVARASALLGEWKTCRKSLSSALALLDADGSADNTVVAEPTHKTAETATKQQTIGGKRAWRSGPGSGAPDGSDRMSSLPAADEMDARRLQSLELFQSHSREEMRREAATIERFMSAAQAKKDGPTPFAHLLPYFLRIFSFSSDDPGASTEGGANDFLAELLRNVEVTFGLGAFAKKVTNKSFAELTGSQPAAPVPAKSSKKKGQEAAAAAAVPPSGEALEAQAALATIAADLSLRFDDAGRLNFKQIFGGRGESSSAAPVKMEICSGAGEWAVAQAESDPGSDWVTLELRHDRVYQTFTKAVFAGVSNLCVLGGDAMRILPQRVPAASLDFLFVNHPEPPQQTGGVDSQGKHLLTREFFLEASRVLRAGGGTCTVVTDNLWYGKFLIRSLSGLLLGDQRRVFQLRSLSLAERGPGDEWALQETASGEGGEVSLFVGKPGRAVAGHVAEASSYFDRLWKRGQLVERYFIVLRKDDTAATSGHQLQSLASACRQVASDKKKVVHSKPQHSAAAASNGGTQKKQAFISKNGGGKSDHSQKTKKQRL